jgi:cytochrome P450
MFKSKLMGALCVVATKADMIKWVLARDGKQFVTGYPKSFKAVLGGDTTLNTVGEQWKSTRKFVVNGLRTEHLRSRVSVVEDLVLECLDSWETKQIVNVREETKSVSSSSTLSLSLSLCLSQPQALQLSFFFMFFQQFDILESSSSSAAAVGIQRHCPISSGITLAVRTRQ